MHGAAPYKPAGPLPLPRRKAACMTVPLQPASAARDYGKSDHCRYPCPPLPCWEALRRSYRARKRTAQQAFALRRETVAEVGQLVPSLWCLSAVVCLHFPGERLVFCRQFEQRQMDLFIGDAGGDAPITIGPDEQVGGDVHERHMAPGRP